MQDSTLSPLTLRILSVLKGIPRGRVMSYGEVARAAGSPRGARQVVRVLHVFSESRKLPWHRVINSQGRISLPAHSGGDRQAALLKKEGWQVDAAGRVLPRPSKKSLNSAHF